MGLKGYRIWFMGQLDSTCRAPPRSGPQPRRLFPFVFAKGLVVAIQVEFEKANFETRISLDRTRVETRRLSAVGQLHSTCTDPPRTTPPPPPYRSGTIHLNLKKYTLKPGYHISGARVETRRFQAMGQLLHSSCTSPTNPVKSATALCGFGSGRNP